MSILFSRFFILYYYNFTIKKEGLSSLVYTTIITIAVTPHAIPAHCSLVRFSLNITLEQIAEQSTVPAAYTGKYNTPGITVIKITLSLLTTATHKAIAQANL